jgi:inositol 1,4,5-triphosphate receptor type 3
LTKQSIFEHIGGYAVISELLDKAFGVLDANMEAFIPGNVSSESPEEGAKVEIASRIIKVMRSAFNIMSVMAKNNEGRVYKRMVKTVFNYRYFNLGQVELMTSLFRDNAALFGQLTHQDFAYFVELIKLHGRYAEFLEFYDTILATAENNSKNSDLHKTVLENLLEPENFGELNVGGGFCGVNYDHSLFQMNSQ